MIIIYNDYNIMIIIIKSTKNFIENWHGIENNFDNDSQNH